MNMMKYGKGKMMKPKMKAAKSKRKPMMKKR